MILSPRSRNVPPLTRRILFKLDELVRPYVHKILVVIEPLLIDEDYYARVEGREIIANLAKAAGLAQMIAAMRPDIDNIDEYVRNTTARAFSVVASALGIPALLPFLKVGGEGRPVGLVPSLHACHRRSRSRLTGPAALTAGHKAATASPHPARQRL